MAYEVKKLNKNMLQAIEIQIYNPTLSMAEVADILGVHLKSVQNWCSSKVYKEALEKRLKEVWADSIKIAQDTMITRAKNGDFRAAEYILNSNGYQAPQQIELNNNVIKVTIDEEEN